MKRAVELARSQRTTPTRGRNSAWALAVVLLLQGTVSCSWFGSGHDDRAEETAIWKLVLHDDNDKPPVVAVETDFNVDGDDPRRLVDLFDRHPAKPSLELAQRFIEVNKRGQMVTNRLKDSGFLFFDPSVEMRTKGSSARFWQRFHAEHPVGQGGFYVLSSVAFSRNQALVLVKFVCHGFCGTAELILLESTERKWHIKANAPIFNV